MVKRLPKCVVFKGDNGKYLELFHRPIFIPSQPDVPVPALGEYFWRFSSDNAHDEKCRYIIEYTNDNDGIIRIKNTSANRYLKKGTGEGWIRPSEAAGNDPSTMFKLEKVSEGPEGTYALQSLDNGCYCTRLTADNKESCLNAGSPSINSWAHLRVEEAVLSRRIFDIKYRNQEANIRRSATTLARKIIAVNRSSNNDEVVRTVKYNVAKERKWDTSVSMKFGVTTSIEAKIPEVVSTKIEFQSEFNESYTLGESITETEENSTEYKVIVSPGTRGVVTVVATQAICDVPFSYSQEDTFFTGEKETTSFDDGIYYGVNCYDIYIEHSEEKISD